MPLAQPRILDAIAVLQDIRDSTLSAEGGTSLSRAIIAR